jgi:hypothetical protein
MMKNMKKLWPVLLVISLTGCFEIQENIDIKNNGSGQLTVNTDMSQMLGMMESYLGKEEMEKQMPEKSIDTTVQMKDLVDTAKNISAENKALFRQGNIHMKLNMTEKLFKADMHFPFSSLGNLQKLYTAMNDGSLNTTNLFKGITSGKAAEDEAGGPATPDMNQFNAIYDFQVKDGFMSRKLNAERWKAVQNSSEFAQMKQATTMGIEIPYTLTVGLPRPVKKIDNPLATLSADKKTVTIKYNLVEVFDHPEKFEYSIAY